MRRYRDRSGRSSSRQRNTAVDSGERLLREMDSFDFIEAWDAAVRERQTVPSVTTQMLIADAVTAHLTTAMSKRMLPEKRSLAAF